MSETQTLGRVCPLRTKDIVGRILKFVETLNDVELYTYQSVFAYRIIESVIGQDGSIITGLWARQCGKTETIAAVAFGLAIILPALANTFPDDPRLSPFLKGFWCGVYAPIHEQAQLPFTRIRQRTSSDYGLTVLADPEISVQLVTNRADTLTWSNGSVIQCRSASPDTNIEGKTWHFVILEEAQKLSRTKVDKEIRPMLTSTNGTMVKIGTAWESRGGFHTSIQVNVDSHAAGGPRNHFEFPWSIVVAEKELAAKKTGKAYHRNWIKFVETERKRLGENSPEFRMNFGCEWQENRHIAIKESVFRVSAVSSLEAGFVRTPFQVAGLDIGKTVDSTVLTIMDVDLVSPIRNSFTLPDFDEHRQNYYVKTILDWFELGGSFEGEVGQYAELVRYLEMTNVKVLVVDATSLGDPVFERIEAMIGGTITCVPFTFGWINKSNLYRYYLQEFNAGRIKYAAGPETRERVDYNKFVQEHLDLDKEDKGTYITCGAPEGGHDDFPDSSALACWAEKIAEEVMMPEIQVLSGKELALPFGGGAQGRRRFMQNSESNPDAIQAVPRGERYRRRYGG